MTDGTVSLLLEGAPDLGDWRAECRALAETCALAYRSDRSAVVVSGERGSAMLNGLLTNDVAELVDSGRHAMLLTAKGRVLTDLRVFPRPEALLLDVPRHGLVNLLAAFRKYLPPLYATYEDAGERLNMLAVYGPDAETATRSALGVAVPESHLGVREVDIENSPGLLIRNRRMGGDGVELITPSEAAAGLASRLLAAVQALDGRAVGTQALEVARIEWGIPAYGVDIDESNLAHETGLEDEAISYDKGCYLGQEVVARVHFRGHVNRRLRGLRFHGEGGPRSSALYQGDKEVGTITSAVDSPDFGVIGLGYVRREIEPATELRWGDDGGSGAVTVEALPFRSV
jgi:folate-binding protein YgfZ